LISGLNILIWEPGKGLPILSSFATGNSYRVAPAEVSLKPYSPTTGILSDAKNSIVLLFIGAAPKKSYSI
jgi:hypothetical protein